MGTSPKTVTCPTCGKLIEWCGKTLFRPFCSERCKLIDLGAWFSGEHAIPGELGGGDEKSEKDGEH